MNRSDLELRLDNAIIDLRIRYKKILYSNELEIERANKVNKLIVIRKRELSLIKLDVIILIKNDLYIFNNIDYITIRSLYREVINSNIIVSDKNNVDLRGVK